MHAEPPATLRVRREPPPFRAVDVRRVQRLSPRMARVTVTGPELRGMQVDDPAASVRLLLPPPGTTELVVPSWTGNEFLLDDGTRPVIRTLTPRRLDVDALELDLDIVLHGTGAASTWAEAAVPGDPAAVSGPGRGYAINVDTPAFLLAGDETAMPAIGQLLEGLPADAAVNVHIEVADADARIALPAHPNATIEWWGLQPGSMPGETLVAAVRAAELVPDARLWAAGEAAAMQRIRRHLFEERGFPRSHATVRGYWKHGRAGEDEGG